MPAPVKETIEKSEKETRTKYFQNFKGINTRASRNAIPEDTFYDLQNLMPIGAANLSTVPGPLLLNSITDTVYYADFATLQGVDYAYLFGTSGQIYQYNIATNSYTTINGGTLMGGVRTRMDQWKNSTILFVDTTGYYSWNGTTFAALTGGIIPSGTLVSPDIAVFSNHVWIYSDRVLYIGGINDYTATTGTGGFLVANGAVVQQLTDPQMRGQVTRMKSASGYLYLVFKSSIFIISDVYIPTSATPPACLFSILNVQATIGTDQPQAVFVNNRDFMFGSKYGLKDLSGVDVSRLSEDIDGTLQYIDPTFPISGGLCTVNNILNTCMFFRTVGDPVFGTRYTVACNFDNKWWFSSNYQYSFVFGVLYGNVPSLFSIQQSGSQSLLYNVFGTSFATLQGSWKTALWPMEDILSRKGVLSAGVELGYEINSIGPVQVQINVDTEARSTPIPNLVQTSNVISWTNNTGGPIAWTNSAGGTITWGTGGYSLYFGDGQGGFGRYVGLSGTVNAGTTGEISAFMMDYQLWTRWT